MESWEPLAYPYKPLRELEEIRLLTIEPGAFDDPLQCSIAHASLATHPLYEALSYSWNASISRRAPLDLLSEFKFVVYSPETGSTVKILRIEETASLTDFPYIAKYYHSLGGLVRPKTINCDSRPVTIGGELHSALRRMRLEDNKRVLWADALCINQNDVQERGEHVQMMRKIYASTQRVLIWFEEESVHDGPGMQVLETVALKLIELGKSGEEPELLRVLFLTDEKIQKLKWGSLSEMLHRVWFE